MNIDLLATHGKDIRPPVDTVFRAWFNPPLDYLWYNIPCLFAILAMILVLTVTSLSVAREREMGTFDQLLVSRCSLGRF
jgi:ABC-2 type transport system permease protein